MNKLIFAFALSISIVACKKETSSPNTQNNGSNSADTTTNSNSSVLINNLDWITGSNFRVAKLCYTEIKPYNWLKQVTCFAIANETALF